MSGVLDSLAANAAARPGQAAIVDGGRPLAWRHLQREVDRLAVRLAGTRCVALFGANGRAWIIADLAALRAKACCIPIPPFFSDEQIRHVLADAEPDLILDVSSVRREPWHGYRAAGSIEVAGSRVGAWQRIVSGTRSIPADVAKVTYTSGTTGSPKGVMLSAAALRAVSLSLAAAVKGRRSDRAAVTAPLAILLENVAGVYVPILCGATVLVCRYALSPAAGPEAGVDDLAAEWQGLRPTTAVVTPGLLHALVEIAGRRPLPDSLRFVAVGGAPVSLSLLERAESLRIPVFQGYGLSEAASVVAVNVPAANRPGSVGRTLSHCRVRVGGNGSLIVAGGGFRGYLGHPEAQATDEFDSGDLGHIDDDGYLYVTGRRRDVIITSGGRNVSPEWVEAVLCARPGIHQAVVAGDDRPYLSAVIVAGDEGSAAAAVTDCNRQLPEYARIRRFLLADAPFAASRGELTANGRPRRQAVLERYRIRIDLLYEEHHGGILPATL